MDSKSHLQYLQPQEIIVITTIRIRNIIKIDYDLICLGNIVIRGVLKVFGNKK